ncbi:MAG: DUF92 domain-containing protein [Melioribacteraceae bacterium]
MPIINPIIALTLLILENEIPNSMLFQNLILGLFFASLITYLSYRLKFLDCSGAIAAFILAQLIFDLGGLKWSVPIITFFISSSILTKLNNRKNIEVRDYFEKSGARDYLQVIANGGIGGILVLVNAFYQNELFYLIYIASLSSVCADTWATEFGTWRKTATYNALNLKPAAQGISGGISVTGLIGALGGSLCIALSAIGWVEISYIRFVILVLLTGFLGSYFDSILGAAVQVQYLCPVCNRVTERKIHCGKHTDYFRGFSWINNDVVNLFSGIMGAMLIVVFKSFIKF